MHYLFVDSETTGTDNEKHGIIELCCHLTDENGQLLKDFSNKMFDKRGTNRVSLGALKVNGSSVKDLWARPEEAPVVSDLVDFLMAIKEYKDIVIVGQNVQFDVGFLKALLKKYGIDDLEQIVGYKFIDTYSIAAALQKAGKIDSNAKLNLSGIANAVGIDTKDISLHTATGDVELTKKVFFKLIEMMK